MPIARKFLDWRQPALVSTVRYLIDRYRAHQQLDLERVLVVTPGARASRKLLELLVEEAHQQQWQLVPPRIETVGRLPELLYHPQRPFASAIVQHLAWVTALRSVGSVQLSRVIPQLPDSHDLPRWMELGELLAGLHTELAAEGLDFQSVLTSGIADGGTDEEKRWRALHRVQEKYLQTLDQLLLWDMQTARLVAIREHECHTDHDVILVATADLNRAVRQMLDQVADHVTALVFAPQRYADRFDEHGCLRPDAWSDVRVPLRDDQIAVAEGPNEQVEEAAHAVARFAEQGYGPSDIVIGAPDQQLAPHLVRRLEQSGAAARWGVGRPLLQHSAARLLAAVAACVENPRFAEFAELLRHPDFYDWVVPQTSAGFLAECDAYYCEHLPPEFGDWLGDPTDYARLKSVHAAIEAWLQPLNGQRLTLAQWSPVIGNLLARIYQQRELDAHDPTDYSLMEACAGIHSALESLLDVPAELAPTVDAAQALRIVLAQLRDRYVAPLPQGDAIEVLGWLELPLDLAPALIVTSFNEGFVPTAVNSDLFLPNSLRKRLKLLDNQRRYARDAYAVQSLAQSRQRLLLVVARRDQRGDPLIPSRLAFADDPQVVAKRVLSVFQPQRGEQPGLVLAMDEGPAIERTKFVVPSPVPMPTVCKLPVTALRAYLQCPYRFYLQYVLGLEQLDDDLEELDAATFGSLLHQVLREFGSGPCRHATDENDIRGALEQALDEIVHNQLGENRLAPVNVQLRQLRARLQSFANWQARWACEGWRIQDVEVPCQTTLDEAVVDGRVLQLVGRLVRIDRHEQTGRWLILDYKSSDAAQCPEKNHFRAGRWVDLQLPLYRRLAKQAGVPNDAGLGYILLPKDITRVGVAIAEWSPKELDDAERAACDVARMILSGEFWPPATDVTYDDYAWICQQNVFHRQLDNVT